MAHQKALPRKLIKRLSRPLPKKKTKTLLTGPTTQNGPSNNCGGLLIVDYKWCSAVWTLGAAFSLYPTGCNASVDDRTTK